MTTKERMKLLTEWKEQFEKCDNTWTDLEKLFRGLDCDSAVGKAIWQTFTLYTDALSKSIGDTGAWLNWYCWENNMGDKKYEAKASTWKKMRKIVNLEVLCKLIEADIEEDKA